VKKRIAALILCAALMLALSCSVLADEKLSFISVNDTLPPELINVATVYSGVTYVPYWLFTNYGLGVYYAYFSSSNAAYFYNADRQLYFSLSDGKTYDEDGYQYTAPAIMRGGTVYLPLGFMSSYFGGFSYSNIGGNEYGSILRINTGNATLTNEEFLRAAKNAMRTYYNAYNKNLQDTPASPEPTESPSHEGETVRLGLRGLPGDAMLERLRAFRMKACFFLTAEEIRGNADLVRRIACEGHGLGIVCTEGTAVEFQTGTALLSETARVRSLLCITPDGQAPAKGAAVFDWEYGTMEAQVRPAALYTVTAALDGGNDDAALLFPCGEDGENALSALLFFLSESGFSVAVPREID